MRQRLKFAEPARVDLEGIREWLSREASPAVAADQLLRIAAAARKLRDFPRIAPAHRQSVRRKTVVATPNVLFYSVEPEQVLILRVWHNRRQAPPL